ncbi:Protein of unknown function [Pyronema omphalodes CBS 100304]|uniref:Uncharacterized protein n=1 Tax=Pyronema omphalodes (strain CBS 100304) TaxID=1076935 RepID=U4KZZ6_PYROM|nr:Protein of unknown function [Pyronema omphalodes CBS 100304]
MGIRELKKYVGDESWLDMIFSSIHRYTRRYTAPIHSLRSPRPYTRFLLELHIRFDTFASDCSAHCSDYTPSPTARGPSETKNIHFTV